MPRALKLDQRLDRYPPILVRLLATRGRGKETWCLSDEQIADASGLPISEVMRISYSFSWDEIGHRPRRVYLLACDIDLEDRETFRRLEYMRRAGRFRHLRNKPDLLRLLDIWAGKTNE